MLLRPHAATATIAVGPLGLWHRLALTWPTFLSDKGVRTLFSAMNLLRGVMVVQVGLVPTVGENPLVRSEATFD